MDQAPGPIVPALLACAALALGAAGCAPGGDGGADAEAGADTTPRAAVDTAREGVPDPGRHGDTIPLPYELSEPRADAVRSLLAERPGWRVAVAEDNRSPLLEEQMENDPDYRPYVRTGEFTGDGREDAAVVLTDGTRFRAFLLRATGGAPSVHPLGEANEWLARGGFFVSEGHVGIGELFTDHLVLYRWDPSAEAMVPLERERGELG